MHRTLTLAALIVAVAAQAHATSPTKPDGPRPDANGDGVVTREEANAFPRLAGHFDAVDTNKDGQLDAAEFAAHRAARQAEMQARAEEHWKAADKDGDGAVSREEAQASMPRMAEHFDTLDANADGRVERAEMQEHRRHKRHHWFDSE
jgi:Ca2+-binding EF-hand superfamily protein